MSYRQLIAAFATAALMSPTAVAAADPVAPQPGTPCPPVLAAAMTVPSANAAPIVCNAGTWEGVDTPYPISDRWLSYGPVVKLHGQGLRNPNLLSGAWLATPLGDDTTCRAEQRAVIPGTPQVGPAKVDQGDPGRPMPFEVVPILFSIEMSGDCLWQRTDA